MSILYIAVPIALAISFLAVITFIYLVRSGQYDDLETPSRRILFDDVEVSQKKEENSEPDRLNDGS